ncbi:MAG TPA: hypothetical protein VNW54_09475 [Granulicella sp.]|jgi:hypothetical protein|nr:hypothetical protein [Granulicella sp.]
MRKRTRYSLLLIAALLAALAVAVFLRTQAPPEVARLLPESDAIVYLNLKPLRAATHFDKSPIARSSDYQSFVNATGIVFERDLDAVAFALQRRDDPNGPNGPVAYSEVFEGRFDGPRLARYLHSAATAEETYGGHTIYTIPVAYELTPAAPGINPATAVARPSRLLRVTQLGYDTIAASNQPTAEQIHSILDRFRAGASPFAGSSLLEARYRDVPLLSSAWAIGHIGLPFSENGHITAFGLQLPVPEDTTFVASLRYTGALRLRIDEILPSEDDAARSTAALSALLDLFRSFQRLQLNARGTQESRDPKDAALRQLIDSLKIQQQKDRAVLTATLPLDLLKQITAANSQTAPTASTP